MKKNLILAALVFSIAAPSVASACDWNGGYVTPYQNCSPCLAPSYRPVYRTYRDSYNWRQQYWNRPVYYSNYNSSYYDYGYPSYNYGNTPYYYGNGSSW